MRQSSLPSVFSELEPLVSNVFQKNPNEWASTCPECGGRDRFIILLSSHKGTPFAFCRQDSSHIWFPDKNLGKQDIAEIRRLQIEVEEAESYIAEREKRELREYERLKKKYK